MQDFSCPAVHIDGSLPWHEKASSRINKVISLSEEKPEYFEMDIVMELQAFWKELLLNRDPSERCTEHQKVQYERIREIMDFIEENYMNRITLGDVAAHIHLCESECSRLFRRYMNVSLFTFLQEYRVERSLEYLSDPELSITQVASMAGFADSNYYSKVFSGIKGCSPRQYRKK